MPAWYVALGLMLSGAALMGAGLYLAAANDWRPLTPHRRKP